MNTIENVTGYQITIDGETYKLHRDVCHEHPEAVHEALGTKSESELSYYLDFMGYANFFSKDGEYLGDDIYGLGLTFAQEVAA